MKKLLAFICAVLMAISLIACSANKRSQTDSDITVYKNGKIYTANADHAYCTAMVVDGDRFVYVGDDGGAAEYEPKAGRVVDLDGRTVIPGLIEGHNHIGFMAAMYSLGYIEIPAGTVTVEDSLAEVRKFVEKHPDYTQYVIGNFSQELDLGATQLDDICADKPVACVGMGLHCLYVNSKFMEVGGIDKNTPDAIPGETYYVRDSDGNPTGKIVELPQTWDAFQKAIKLDNDRVKEEFLKLQKLYHSYGFIGAADGGFLGLDEENMLKNITELEADDALSMIICTSSIWYGHNVTALDEITQRAVNNKKTYTTTLVRPGTVKMWADGTIGAHSALMREPYADKDSIGSQLSTVDDLIACAEMCKVNDLNIHYHAIGDRAIENVLTVFETVGKTTGTKSVVHFQITPPDIIQRASKIDGLIVNMTPSWATVLVPEEVEPLGERRNYNAQARECINAGITVNFGADSNGNESLWNPSMIMDIAMIRRPDQEGFCLKAESCTFEDCVDAYSVNVAKERRIDDEYGSIEVGKLANFVFWDMDAMNTAVSGGEATLLEAFENQNMFYAQEVYFHGENVFSRQ